MKELLHYIPIFTTIFSIYFLSQIGPHYKAKPKAKYLLWWMIGVITFGLGTLAESINTLFGWSVINFKLWYIVGALLGGFPLAQGTVYLFFKERTADRLSWVFVFLISAVSLLVFISPISLPSDFDGRLSGTALGWSWIRMFSPFINIYAFIFLFGGAIYSSVKYFREGKEKRFIGNVFIAIGALLPGIGGSFTRFGYVEVLYVTEFLGLVSIYYGYSIIKNDRSQSLHAVQT